MVSNLHSEITSYWHDRYGRLKNSTFEIQRCDMHKKSEHLKYPGPRFFNTLPAIIRNSMGCLIKKFKCAVDKYQQSVPDQPSCGGYVDLSVVASINLVDQQISPAVCALPRLWVGRPSKTLPCIH